MPLLEENKKLNEDCGCGGAKEIGGDNVHGDWVDGNLSQINQMVGDAGDIGAGGCPPGQHFCAELGRCHSDHAPQIEPLTLMGADVINLQERISKKIKKELNLITEQNPNCDLSCVDMNGLTPNGQHLCPMAYNSMAITR